MTTAARHPLVEDYLKRLWSEAARLPVDQARELVADIDEHLDAALGQEATEADVRNVLERLGTPRELVTAAGASGEPRPTASKSFASPGGAIICLVAAEILSILLPLSLPLWILGLVMMARATVWSERDRMLGFIGLGSGFPAGLLFYVASLTAVRSCESWTSSDGMSGGTCGGVDWVAIVAWTLIAAYLAFQLFAIWRLVRSARPR